VFAVPDNEARRVELDSLNNRLRYQSGEIKLRDGVASIALNQDFKYLDPAGTETLLTGIWGNPASGSKLLGAIVPSDFDPFNHSAWCVIVDFIEDGYVSDSDAEKTDYTKLLAEMKKETLAANETRESPSPRRMSSPPPSDTESLQPHPYVAGAGRGIGGVGVGAASVHRFLRLLRS
jgi:uncharacterized membrane-anchored protein